MGLDVSYLIHCELFEILSLDEEEFDFDRFWVFVSSENVCSKVLNCGRSFGWVKCLVLIGFGIRMLIT